jgi:hypothetical protein
LAGHASAAAVYPVKVGPTGRYLVDQKNVPFLITGESPQAMIGDLSLSDAQLFFANRQAHGFNTVWINLLCNSYTGCNADGSTFDGIPPFTTPGDLATPNEAYFTRADRILQLAAQYGFLVILDPIETGGWLGVLQANGVAKARAYGEYLGRRYAAFDNILWMHGNDYDFTSSNDALVGAVAAGIRDFDSRHLHTLELTRFSTSLDDPQFPSPLDLDAAYSGSLPYVEVLKAYNRPQFLPTFLVEANYEFEGADNHTLRSQEYWSLLTGATGQLYGNTYTWQFLPGWQTQLNTPGAVQMSFVRALFEPRPWYALVPDQTHTVLSAGVGTFGAADYVTAARTPDGTLVMAYLPYATTVTLDLTQLSGPATARWYDPAAGSFVLIPGSPLPNTGSHNFTAPGNNADGDQDWILVLEVLTPTDTTPPSISITSPTTADTFSTSSAVLTLGGVASDNVGVTQVTWANNRGGSGTATGTTSWTASNIELKLGSNVLTVTALDAAGNTRTDTLTVCRTAFGRSVLCR